MAYKKIPKSKQKKRGPKPRITKVEFAPGNNSERTVPINAELPEGAIVTTPDGQTRDEFMKDITDWVAAIAGEDLQDVEGYQEYMALSEMKRQKFSNFIYNYSLGNTQRESCRLAGMSNKTVNSYQRKYPFINNIILAIQDERCQNVESALYRSAIGFSYNTTKTIKKYQVDEHGNIQNGGLINVEEHTQEHRVPPNSQALLFFLKNILRDKYKSDNALSITVRSDEEAKKQLDFANEVKDAIGKMEKDDLKLIAQTASSVAKNAEARLNGR